MKGNTMLHANQADSAKISLAVRNLLDHYGFVEVEEPGKAIEIEVVPQLYVRLRDFYNSCRVTTLRRAKFPEEVNDILTGTALVQKFGHWVFTEIADNYHAFLYLGPYIPGTGGVEALIEFGKGKGQAEFIDFAANPKAARNAVNVPDDDDCEAEDDEDFDEERNTLPAKKARKVALPEVEEGGRMGNKTGAADDGA